MEHGPGGYSSTEQPRLSREDRLIEAAIRDPEASRALYNSSHVEWLRAAIALDTQRDASEITTGELMVRYFQYGRFEWDPAVTKSVRKLLRNNGFI